MGVIYKLTPKVRNFIIEKKKEKTVLSCRSLTALIEKEFQVKVSKSSINSLIKQAGLSMPVGRRRKPRRGVVETKRLGAIILKAADYILGGTTAISEVIKSRIQTQVEIPDLALRTEQLLYEQLNLNPGILSRGNIDTSFYLNELQQVITLPTDISHILSSVFQEVRCIRINLSDGGTFYLDGQLHTAWSTPHVPYDFSTTLYTAKSYMKRYLQEDNPFLLFMAPGYDTPSKEFFDFILGLEGVVKKPIRLTFHGNRFEELESMRLEKFQRRFFVFGLWPWQFSNYRKVKSIGEFRPFYFEPLKEGFYITNIEVELSQPYVDKSVTLIGCALKKNIGDKIKLVILTNLPSESAQPESLTNLYLSRWPNIEEAFQDFSRKIELFTYTANSQLFLSTQTLPLDNDKTYDVKSLFGHYVKLLDLYARWRFLPVDYQNKDLSTMEERFYSLSGKLKKEKEFISLTLKVPMDYKFLKDLEYICRRINEMEMTTLDGVRIWVTI